MLALLTAVGPCRVEMEECGDAGAKKEGGLEFCRLPLPIRALRRRSGLGSGPRRGQTTSSLLCLPINNHGRCDALRQPQPPATEMQQGLRVRSWDRLHRLLDWHTAREPASRTLGLTVVRGHGV